MPTARELTREGWQPYIEAASRRPHLPDLTVEEHRERERLLGRVRLAAAELKKRFSVRRVMLFGSLAHEAWFVADSDVDLAVEGLDGDAYWHAWRIVEEAMGDRLVDLIEVETATGSLRRAIERHGIEL
jgi:predicted nucleotidyltransferase